MMLVFSCIVTGCYFEIRYLGAPSSRTGVASGSRGGCGWRLQTSCILPAAANWRLNKANGRKSKVGFMVNRIVSLSVAAAYLQSTQYCTI